MTNKALGATSARLLSVLSQEDRTIFSVADAQRVLGTSYDATKKTVLRLSRTRCTGAVPPSARWHPTVCSLLVAWHTCCIMVLSPWYKRGVAGKATKKSSSQRVGLALSSIGSRILIRFHSMLVSFPSESTCYVWWIELFYYGHTALGSCSHRVVRLTEYGTESPLHLD